MTKILSREVLHDCHWFQLTAKHVEGENSPYYALSCQDYVSVVCETVQGEIALVNQFRPAIEKRVIHFPTGHIHTEEKPIDAAVRELSEETGCYEFSEIECVGNVHPDVGRLENKLWGFWVRGAKLSRDWQPPIDEQLQRVFCPRRELRNWVETGRFVHALDLVVLHLATLKGFRY